MTTTYLCSMHDPTKTRVETAATMQSTSVVPQQKVANLPLDAAPTLESHIVISESTEGRQFVANPYYFKVDTAGNQLPYINEMDEIFVGESEVRLLKLVNG